jgi:type IV pilus assembly protein PilN
VHLYFQGRIDFQHQRNQYLEREIAILDRQIAEIQDLERERERIIARMEIIQELQASRPDVVHRVEELVSTLPEGVFYQRIEQKGRRLNLQGVAQSNARVSSLMRRLDGSQWLADPELVEIKAEAPGGAGTGAPVRVSNFNLNVSQPTQKRDNDAPGG